MVNNPDQAQLSLQTPGEILKEAREKKDLSQQELSKLLHLNLNIISYLENDQYEKISAPTYTRGYLRSYARVVDVDEDSIIQLFNNNQSTNETPEIIPEVSQKSQISSSDKPVKIMTYLISFALVLLLLVWWQSKYIVITPDQSSIDEPSGIESSQNVEPPAFDYDYKIIVHSDKPILDLDSGQATESTNDDITPVVSNPVDETEQSININSNTLSGLTGDLTIFVDEESWIEVYNGADKKLLMRLVQSGSVINVTGLTPLSVLLGHASGVRVKFNSNDVDIDPFTRADVTRLKLGE